MAKPHLLIAVCLVAGARALTVPVANRALTIPDAKARVRSALADHEGCTKEAAVAEAIDALAALNPTAAPARSALLSGQWKQINAPEYPLVLGKDEEGNQQYTLGRLAFNLFEPKDLVCSISDVMNPLSARATDETIDYAIEVPLSFSAESGERVRGKLLNFAECDVVADDRVSVRFLGGELRPEGEAPCAAWTATFGDALQTAKRGLGARASGWLMKRMMGLEPPRGMAADGVMAYSMSRAPEGWLDVIFLDDEWRITRGNRGSIVVCERVAE